MPLVFRCRQCHTVLTGGVQYTAWSPLPRIRGREHHSLGPSTVVAGGFSIDPEPFRFRDVTHETVVINPSDGARLQRHADSARLHGCCGLDGLDGPNLLCQGCEEEVGVEISDCWTEHDVRLIRSAVVAEPVAADGVVSSAG